jgi:putative peptide zinc metalloprotease protein
MIPKPDARMAAETLPVRYRLRSDISWTKSQSRGEALPHWTAADPLSRRLFRCGEFEYRLLCWLDGKESIQSLAARFRSDFAPKTITLQSVQELIHRCWSSGLLQPVTTDMIATASGTAGGILFSDSDKDVGVDIPDTNSNQRRRWILDLSRHVASSLHRAVQYKWSLGSPDSLVDYLLPAFGWLVSGPAKLFWSIVIVVFTVLIAMQWNEVWKELPSWDAIRSPGMLVGYGLIFVLTRVVHEFGHAIVCRKHGAACRDIGLMFSYGMICPYVDITDSWRTCNRWQRMSIALAGIYFELTLASMAAALWLGSHSGWLHDLAFQTMLVCSVTTILFNANPLLKYDGYYVLCDLLDTQQLRERAFRSFDTVLSNRYAPDSLPMSVFLATYFIASSVQRIVMACSIIALVYYFFCQWQLAGLGLGLIAVSLGCNLILQVARWSQEQQMGRQLGRRAMWLGWTATCLLIAWAVNIPLPGRVSALGEMRFGESTAVYAAASGCIENNIDKSHAVATEVGQLLLLQSNGQLERSILALEAKRIRLVQQLKTMRRAVFFENHADENEAIVHAQLEIVDKQLMQRWQEKEKLRIASPGNGYFIPATAKPAFAPESPSDFWLVGETVKTANATWTEQASVGRYLERGEMIGWLVKSPRMDVECELSEYEIPDVTIGTEARVRLLQLPERVFAGQVVEVTIAKNTREQEQVPGTTQTTSKSAPGRYRVRISLNESPLPPDIDAGTAEIVLLKPKKSILHEARDFWLRNARMR